MQTDGVFIPKGLRKALYAGLGGIWGRFSPVGCAEGEWRVMTMNRKSVIRLREFMEGRDG